MLPQAGKRVAVIKTAMGQKRDMISEGARKTREPQHKRSMPRTEQEWEEAANRMERLASEMDTSRELTPEQKLDLENQDREAEKRSPALCRDNGWNEAVKSVSKKSRFN